MDKIISIHDSLYKLAKECIFCVTYEDLKNIKNLFIISVIEEVRLKTFLDGLYSVNPQVCVNILVQDYVYEGFTANFSDRCKVFSWHGVYSSDIMRVLSDKIAFPDIDAFVFFSDFSMNLRDLNFLEMAEMLYNEYQIKTFNCTIGNDIYGYKNYGLYRQCLIVYESIGKLLDLYLNSIEMDDIE